MRPDSVLLLYTPHLCGEQGLRMILQIICRDKLNAEDNRPATHGQEAAAVAGMGRKRRKGKRNGEKGVYDNLSSGNFTSEGSVWS